MYLFASLMVVNYIVLMFNRVYESIHDKIIIHLSFLEFPDQSND